MHLPFSDLGFGIVCVTTERLCLPPSCHTFVTEIGRYPSCYGPEAVWYHVSHASLLCFRFAWEAVVG